CRSPIVISMGDVLPLPYCHLDRSVAKRRDLCFCAGKSEIPPLRPTASSRNDKGCAVIPTEVEGSGFGARFLRSALRAPVGMTKAVLSSRPKWRDLVLVPDSSVAAYGLQSE